MAQNQRHYQIVYRPELVTIDEAELSSESSQSFRSTSLFCRKRYVKSCAIILLVFLASLLLAYLIWLAFLRSSSDAQFALDDEASSKLDPETNTRRAFIRKMVYEAWTAYTTYAWGDEGLCPLSKRGYHFASNSRTIVSALSTLFITNLKPEYQKAQDWLDEAPPLNATQLGAYLSDASAEHLGTFLSMYALTQNTIWLDRAASFYQTLDQQAALEKASLVNNLEVAYLHALRPDLAQPKWIHLNGPEVDIGKLSKLFLQNRYSGFQASLYLEMLNSRFAESYEKDENQIETFAWTALAIAAIENSTDAHLLTANEASFYLSVAETKVGGFIEVSRRTATGLPHEAGFDNLFIDEDDYPQAYGLTARLAETLFVLYRLTGKSKYRDAAWNFANVLYERTRVPGGGGFAGVTDVNAHPVQLYDYQEPIFLAATLKYLYLIFSPDDLFNLQDWIFNDAGQPIPLF